MIRAWRLLVLAVCIGTAGCGAQTDSPLSDPDEAAIRKGVESALTAANANDYAAWAAIYAEDAMLLPPNGPIVQGRAAIHEWLTRLPPTSDWTLEVEEVEGRGDLAYVRGTYSLMIALPGLTPIAQRGKFIQIWRAEGDGIWKAEREIYNSDLPLSVP